MVTARCPVRGQALRNPEELALVALERRWTWAALDREVERAAGRLHAGNVRPGEHVAVLAANHPSTVVLLFALRRVGAALVPLNVRLARAELRAQVDRVHARVLLADADRREVLPGATPLEEWPDVTAVPWPGDHSDAAADWALLFTSGTTGEPKAARLSVGAFDALARASAANLGPRRADRWLCNLPLFHVGGLATAVRCAHDGATLVLHPRFDAGAVVAAVRDQGITHLSLVARTLEQCLDAGLQAGQLRGVLVGGGPVPPALVERARGAGIPVLLTYGLTEACSQVTTERPGEADGRTAGAPLPGLEVEIVGADGRALPAGEEGTIAVRGATLMRGYLDDPAATAEVLRHGWLQTGDIGRLDRAGRLTVLARRTDLILSGGENVYPAEVEAVLATHPAVAEVAIVGRPDPRWGQVPVAVVVARTAVGSLGDLEAWARARLAAFKVPAEVLPAAALPRTAAGKVDRAAVQAWVTAPSRKRSGADGVQVVLNKVNQMETTPGAAGFLESAEGRLSSVLSHGSGEVGQSDTLLNAGRHLCIGSGGKRVRPTMVHLFGLAAGAPEAGLLRVAVAAELVHSASLLHDDVVDAGMYRRGRPTVNALWGNVVAVMGGDLLLTLALDELAALDREITFAAVRTVAEMTRATIGEVEARGDLSLSVERFRGIMEGKTGALFGFCGAAAGRLAGKDDVARRFETFGRHLGVAFQIADDLKDLNGGDPGKPVFADFKSRTPSLPILLAAQMDEPLRRRIKDLWAFGSMADERVRELGVAVLATDAPRAALHLMDREIEAALEALGPLRDSPGADELTDWARRLGAAFR